MADPYRPSAETSSRRVIAQRSSGALMFYLVLSLLGLAMPWVALKWGREVPALFVLAFVAVPAGFMGLGRSLHAYFLPHSIAVDENGLHCAWADTIFGLPWLRRRDRELPWSELTGVRTHSISINGASSTELVVSTTNGTFSVPDDRFDRSAHMIQRDILDFLDRRRERPIGARGAFVQQSRERFATPERLIAKPWGVIGSAALFLPFIVFPVWLAWELQAWFTSGFAVLAVGIFGSLTVMGVTQWLDGRVLVLRSDGLAIGRNEAAARLIPWHDIHTVRRVVTNGNVEAIEIVQQDGTHVNLRLNYGLELEDIARMIDPESSSSSER
jgi:hypothetical protein